MLPFLYLRSIRSGGLRRVFFDFGGAQDIGLLTAEAMVSEDGSVQYADEVRRAFELLLTSLSFEKFAAEWEEGKVDLGSPSLPKA